MALEGLVDEPKGERRDIFEYGMQFAAFGADSKRVGSVLSNLIARERDEDARRLKEAQRDAVLCIQEGRGSSVFLHRLISHMDNSELNIAMRLLSDTEIFKNFHSEGRIELAGEKASGAVMDGGEFAERLAHIVRRACEFSRTARSEGLLALEDLVDEPKVRRRDIFEYGMHLVLEGTDSEIIDSILSNLLAQERGEGSRRLGAIQKEAVLGVRTGDHFWLFLPTLISHIDNSELEALKEALSDTNIFKMSRSEDGEPAGAAGVYGPVIVPTKFFKTLKNLLGEYIGSHEAAGVINRFASNLQVGPFDFLRQGHPRTIALLLAYIEPSKASILLQNLPQDIRGDVAQCFASVDRASPEIFREVERTLGKKLATVSGDSRTVSITGDAEVVASIIRLVDVEYAQERQIIEALEADDPEFAEEIGRRMFLFKDIVLLDGRSIQKILREVDAYELIKALKGADAAEARGRVFANMSKRAAAMLKEEMEYMGAIEPEDVEAAREGIASLARGLEKAGEIPAARPGKEVAVSEWFPKDLAELLEESVGRQNAVGVMSRLASDFLGSGDPESAEEVTRMFSLEGIAAMGDRSAQRFLRELDPWVLFKALKGAGAEVQGKVFRNITKRAVAVIMDDLECMGAIGLGDVLEAQMQIALVIRSLGLTVEP